MSMPTSAPPARRLAGVDLGVCVGLVLVTLALYAPLRHHEFLSYDDNEYVTEHPVVRTGLNRASVAWALTHAHHATWHPLTSLSHLLDVELFGLDAGAHLAVNVVLHTLATVILFLVLLAMTGARWPSAWVAAAFAWHPLHVESVAWVSERKDVLSGLFWMLTLASYVAYVRRPTRWRWLVVGTVFGLGLLAKPMLVTLPFVLLLLDYWPLRRGDDSRAAWIALGREKLPLLALAAAASAVTVVTQRNAGALDTLATSPLSYRVANALLSYVTYLRKTVWPSDLAVFYPPAAHLSAWSALAAAIGLTLATVLILRTGRRARPLTVGWLWYLGTLVPVLGLVRQGDQALADRFTYLPSIGLFLMIAWGARTLVPARALAVAGVVSLATCLAATARQIDYWQDSRTLFEHALAVTTDNYVAHNGLGLALSAAGRDAEAMPHYRRARELQPGYAKVRLNLGNALARAGDGTAAEAEYREALRLDPHAAPAAYDLGLLLAERGALDEAVASYHRALALDPMYARAWHNLGWALAAKGDLAGAVAAYERALAIDPTLTVAHNNLAVALEGLGRGDDALLHYAAAVRLAPTEPRAYANYGAVLASHARWDEAIAAYQEALRLAPDFSEVRAALAAALAARDAGAPGTR